MRPSCSDDPRDYADETARLRNIRTVQWLHPLSETIGAVIAGRLCASIGSNEHDGVPWRMFRVLVGARRLACYSAGRKRPWLTAGTSP